MRWRPRVNRGPCAVDRSRCRRLGRTCMRLSAALAPLRNDRGIVLPASRGASMNRRIAKEATTRIRNHRGFDAPAIHGPFVCIMPAPGLSTAPQSRIRAPADRSALERIRAWSDGPPEGSAGNTDAGSGARARMRCVASSGQGLCVRSPVGGERGNQSWTLRTVNGSNAVPALRAATRSPVASRPSVRGSRPPAI